MPSAMVAIILGASEWPRSRARWQGAPAFGNSAADFKSYLKDVDGLHLQDDAVLDLFDDPRSADDIDDAIDRFLTERRAAGALNDVLLYFTGHGAFAEDRRYCLAIRATRVDALGQSGYRVASLARTINRNMRVGRRFVILDACFAAAAEADFIAQSDAATRLEEQTMSALADAGTALLCATSSTDVALAPRAGVHTMFSGALLQALREGSPSGGQRLSFDDLRNLVAQRIEQSYREEAVIPEIHVPDQRRGDISRIALFPNPRFAALPSSGDDQRRKSLRRRRPAQRLDSPKIDEGVSRRTILAAAAIGVPGVAVFMMVGRSRRDPPSEQDKQLKENPPAASGTNDEPGGGGPTGATEVTAIAAPPPATPVSSTLPHKDALVQAKQRECADIRAKIVQSQSIGDNNPGLVARLKELRCH